MKAYKMIFLVVAFAPVSRLQGQDLTGKVTNIIDGNTLEIVATDHETYTILLHGIDSPEPGQNFSEQAKKLLEQLLLHKTVVISMHGKDRWGNRLGVIHVKNGPDPRHELVKAGLAWTTEKEPIEELESLKEQARQEGKGLWQEENPTPPWIYRRQQTMLSSKSS